MVAPRAAHPPPAPDPSTTPRRSISPPRPFRSVMALPSLHSRSQKETARSQRVQHAQGVLVSRPDTRAPPGHCPEVLKPEGVTARPEPDQPVGVVTQLAQ